MAAADIGWYHLIDCDGYYAIDLHSNECTILAPESQTLVDGFRYISSRHRGND